MKKFTLLLSALLMFSLSALAQIKMYLHFNDGTRVEYIASRVDSITFDPQIQKPDDSETPDGPILPDDEDPTDKEDDPFKPDDDPVYDGTFVTKPFSVSATKTVTFSSGNLQYHAANDEWRFAPNQTDYIGEANANISSTYNGWIDLFGWGTGNNPTNASENNYYYQTFVDLGVNQIGNYSPNTWRTLTDNEWYYLCYERANYNKLIGVAQVNGVNGLILLPDNWTCPSGVTFKSGFHDYYGTDYYAEYQTFSSSDWSKLEASGAVFFPAAGYRHGSNVYSVQYNGRYWSATESYYDAYYLSFYSGGAGVYYGDRYVGQSVRLVQDNNNQTDDEDAEDDSEKDPIKPDDKEENDDPVKPDDDPVNDGSFVAKAFSVAENKTVTFSPGNLQYHAANDEWRFAPNQTDYIGGDNENISSTYNGWIDLFGWGTGNNPTKNSTDNSDYQTFVDWGVNKIGSYAPNTWRTLTYDEWFYLCFNRTNAGELKGIAQVNGVNGLILLPDSWICPSGVTFKSGFDDDWCTECYGNYQTFSSSEWSKLESSGAVFFPATGDRLGFNVSNVQDYGIYWSATEYDYKYAFYLYFYSGAEYMDEGSRYVGLSVRLVQDNNNQTDDDDTEGVVSEPTGYHNTYGYVDLGLSSGTLWATMNVGADSPEDYGDYFAWGETTTKSEYNLSTYKWMTDGMSSWRGVNKYTFDDGNISAVWYDKYGNFIGDNKTVLELADDAANANWGSDWRMPTTEELDELSNECTWTWEQKNGVNGYTVIGPNGNSIFLPAAGYRDGSDLYGAGSYGDYWSSSLYSSLSYGAYGFSFHSRGVGWGFSNRDYGQSVRPVLP